METLAPDPADAASTVVAQASDLLASLGRTDAGSVAVDVTGCDPVLATRFRVGEAAAAALVAVGVASGDLWTMRGGAPQRLAIDVRAAASSLLSFALLRVAGRPLEHRRPATVALYRTRDGGWVHLHGGFPHLHAGTLALLGCADDVEAIARAVTGWDAADLEEALADAGLCGARLRSAAEWSAHPQGKVLASVPVVEVARIGDAAPTPLPGPSAGLSGARPLGGVRVLVISLASSPVRRARARSPSTGPRCCTCGARTSPSSNRS